MKGLSNAKLYYQQNNERLSRSVSDRNKIMTIEVKQSYSYEEPITVVVDDLCNHAGAEEQEVDYGYPDATIGDYVDDWRQAMVCDKCNEVVED